MPSSLYLNRQFPDTISALCMHARHRFSPASGYHARDPSCAPAWPGLFSGPSREEQLADQVTRRRLLKNLEKEVGKVESLKEFIQWSNESILEPDEQCLADNESESSEHEPSAPHTSWSWPLTNTITTEKATNPWGSRARSFAPLSALLPASEHTRKSALKHSRSATVLHTPETLRNRTSSKLHKWAVNPILRKNPHPVLLQPMRQLRLRRMGSCRPPPTREGRWSISNWAGNVRWTPSTTDLVKNSESSDDDLDLTLDEADQLMTAQEYLSETRVDDEGTAFAGEDHRNSNRMLHEHSAPSDTEVHDETRATTLDEDRVEAKKEDLSRMRAPPIVSNGQQRSEYSLL